MEEKKEEQFLNIGEAVIGVAQVMEMAEYINHLEKENNKLLSDLQQTKAYLTATVQQRNSLNAKLKNIINEKNNTIDIKPIVSSLATNVELVNPEVWAVPEGRVITTPKADRI